MQLSRVAFVLAVTLASALVAPVAAAQLPLLGGAPELGLTLEDAPDPVARGANLTLFANVTNAGSDDAEDLVVEVALPPALAAQAAAASGEGASCALLDAARVRCEGGAPLPPGESRSFVVWARPEQAGGFQVLANATATDADPATASADVTVQDAEPQPGPDPDPDPDPGPDPGPDPDPDPDPDPGPDPGPDPDPQPGNATGPPPPPVLLECGTNDRGNVLAWNSTPEATRHRVFRSLDGGAFRSYADVAGTSYVDLDVEPTREQRYRVVAVGPGGLSEPSAECALTATPVLPFLLGGVALVLGGAGAYAWRRSRQP